MGEEPHELSSAPGLLLVVIFSVIIGVIGAIIKGFRKTQTATQATAGAVASPSPAPEPYHDARAVNAPTGQTKYFKGSIGSNLDLQMKLTREGEQITGSYYYQKVGTKIDLKGTVDKDNNVTLEEFDTKGKATGVFKGIWKVDNEDGLAGIAGNWSRPGGEKKTAFSIHEQPIEFSGGAELVAKQIKETNKKLRYEIKAEYPQVSGASDTRFDKFNQEAKALVLRKVAEFRKEMTEREPEEQSTQGEPSTQGSDLGIGYDIAMANDNLISVEFDIGGYSEGAAHPNSYTEVLNYDVKAGKKLKLGDLFKPGAKYLQTISDYSIRDLKKQSKANGSSLPDDMIASGAAPKPENYKSWMITRKGLSITFDAYQVGPYAAGPQKVILPYSVLKGLIKPDGSIGSFA